MYHISSTAGLKETIHLLEDEHALKGQLLKEQLHQTYQSLKPVNLLKSTLDDITSSPYMVDNILITTLGLATGYLSKRIAVKASGNIFRKLFGTVLQIGITNLVAHNAKGIKTIGRLVLQQFFNKKEANSKIS
jgi:hypothetical protein